MVAFPHILTSVALSRVVRNPYFLPPAAFALHFLIDIIPHWDYHPLENISFKKSMLFVILDHSIGVLTVFAIGYYFEWSFMDYKLAAISAFFGLLPDVMSKTFKFFILKENKYTMRFRVLHRRLHLIFIEDFINDFHKGFYQQIIISILAVVVIIYKS